MSARFWLLLAFSLAGAGCTSVIQTKATRAASFAPYAQVKIGNISAHDFLQVHYAMLLVGPKIYVKRNAENPSVWTWEGEGISGMGSAVPIDRRGYFLTAAHCLGTGPLNVVFIDWVGMHTEVAHVVWRGDAEKPKTDLALLRVPRSLDFAVKWAPKVEVGEKVMGAGLDYEFKPGETASSFDYGYFGGRVVALSRPSRDEKHVVRVAHSAPAHPGDSGGPLLDTEGNLLAINTEGVDSSQAWIRVYMSLSSFRGYSCRPDLEWLKRLIDRDYAEHSTATWSSVLRR